MRNDDIKKTLKAKSLESKVKENTIRSFGHLIRMDPFNVDKTAMENGKCLAEMKLN